MAQRRERHSKQKSLMNVNKPGRLFMACLRAGLSQFLQTLLVLQGQTPTAHRVHGKLLSQPKPARERSTIPTYVNVVGVDVVRVGITQQRVQLHSVPVVWRAK